MTQPVSCLNAETVRVAIDRETPLAYIQSVARNFALARGFDCRFAAELAIAVSELASNVQKFAEAGRLDVSYRDMAVEVVVTDSGPGLMAPELVLNDGFTTDIGLDGMPAFPRRSLGMGLGAVRRMSDSFEIAPGPGGGTRVWFRKSR